MSPSKSLSFLEFVKIVLTDSLKLALIWVLLWLFHFLPKYMPVEGFAGKWMEAIHQLGSVAVVILLVIFLIIDVIESHRENK